MLHAAVTLMERRQVIGMAIQCHRQEIFWLLVHLKLMAMANILDTFKSLNAMKLTMFLAGVTSPGSGSVIVLALQCHCHVNVHVISSFLDTAALLVIVWT
jgi:hypothetical protein